jgi:hypothetical protein
MVGNNALQLCSDVLLLTSRFGILEINVAKMDIKGRDK